MQHKSDNKHSQQRYRGVPFLLFTSHRKPKMGKALLIDTFPKNVTFMKSTSATKEFQ